MPVAKRLREILPSLTRKSIHPSFLLPVDGSLPASKASIGQKIPQLVLRTYRIGQFLTVCPRRACISSRDGSLSSPSPAAAKAAPVPPSLDFKLVVDLTAGKALAAAAPGIPAAVAAPPPPPPPLLPPELLPWLDRRRGRCGGVGWGFKKRR